VTVAIGSGYEDLAARFGQFDCVISVEVMEHLYHPRLFARRMFDLVTPGGSIIVTTPYHGYLKNLALAVTGHLDNHFTALWDGGHIKFWSVKTLRFLLQEAGFEDVHFQFAGRIPPLAKSMIAVARRPR
jgi:2-polyprenyl-6-hydroxyphenyl methylase/3-demethylubiquinone-9 3-methyltransferase